MPILDFGCFLTAHFLTIPLTIESADPIPDSAFEVSDELINPNANAETKALYTFLCDIYGKQVLSGHFADQGLDSDEFKGISKNSFD